RPGRRCPVRGLVSRVQRGFQVRLMGLARVLDPDQRGRMLGQLERLGHDEGNWLAAELDLVIVQRPEGRSRGCHLVAVTTIEPRESFDVLVGEHPQYAGQGERRFGVDRLDLAPRDVAGDDAPVRQIGNVVFGGVLRFPRDLETAIDAIDRLSDVIRAHGRAAPYTKAACASPLTMARFASGSLNALNPKSRAPRSMRSATPSNVSREAGWPASADSVARSRQGL